MKNYLFDFIHLFFPECCVSCGTILHKNEKTVCLQCLSSLPKTNDWVNQDEKLTARFSSMYPCSFVASFLFLSKGGKVEKLLHQLKYNQCYEVGETLGTLFAHELPTDKMATYDIIIPVPIHPKKKKKRGYNQCVAIAEGLSKILSIPYSDNICVKTSISSSQTNKGRLLRVKNVENAFDVVAAEKLENLSVLLIDDVITTGATIDYLCESIVKKCNVKDIGILSIARK